MESRLEWVEMHDHLKGIECCSEYGALLLVWKTKLSWVSHDLIEGACQFYSMSSVDGIKGKHQPCWSVLNGVSLGFPFSSTTARTQHPESMTSNCPDGCLCRLALNHLLSSSVLYVIWWNHSCSQIKPTMPSWALSGPQLWLLRMPHFSFLWKWLPITNCTANLSKQGGSS